MQTYTSKETSINSVKLPAVYRKAELKSAIVLDYGCGRYIDHIREALAGKTYLPFDPFNQPENINSASADVVRDAMNRQEPVDVVCSNVLNVIDDDGTIRRIVDRIESIIERTGGTAYFTVYEGNRSGEGRKTGADQYQRNATLRSYLQFFRMKATIRNGMITLRSGC